ncbi:hypothetical protein E2C01_047628 [Portunus trituberculatus]|uniref:Uncharacterized protein n=1 Tax=Portunus trituberculatus TaxID=210409 RepID=A0A5B7G7Z2_PORTR|nr:hypothetical protein [Portunus trituberculatus]
MAVPSKFLLPAPPPCTLRPAPIVLSCRYSSAAHLLSPTSPHWPLLSTHGVSLVWRGPQKPLTVH